MRNNARAWTLYFWVLGLFVLTALASDSALVAIRPIDNELDNEIDNELDNDAKQTAKQIAKQTAKQKKAKKNKAKPVVDLPPPTIYHYQPLSKTRKWLRRLRLCPSRLLRSTKSSASRLRDLQTTSQDNYNPKTGFEMAVLSSLAYWEFHKAPPPENATGFALLPPVPPSTKNSFHSYYYRTKLKNWCSSVIREAFPIASSLQRTKNNNNNNNETGAVVVESNPQQQEAKEKYEKQQKYTQTNNHHNRRSKQQHGDTTNPFYTLEYSFYNWHEPTGVKGVSFHDTDVLISTADHGNTLVISFAGTASVADALTNVQTFEPANHSCFFEPPQEPEESQLSQFYNRWKKMVWKQPATAGNATLTLSNSATDKKHKKKNKKGTTCSSTTTTKTQGSLHRGFLNAYSRVDRGSVLRIQKKNREETRNQQPLSQNPYPNNSSNDNRIANHRTKWWRRPRRILPHKLQNKKFRQPQRPPILEGLDRRFGHCHIMEEEEDSPSQAKSDSEEQDESEKTAIKDNATDNVKIDTEKSKKNKKENQKKKKKKKKAVPRRGGCKVTDKAGTNGAAGGTAASETATTILPPIRLSVVLKELVETALDNGYKVHVTGHSLGGALATLLVLDVLINHHDSNHDDTITNKTKRTNHRNHKKIEENLYLWTFGAPQIADSLFWESLLEHSSRLRRFLLGANAQGSFRHHHRQSFHRYVTLSDDGKVDAVSEVAKNTLAAHKESKASSNTNDDDQDAKAVEIAAKPQKQRRISRSSNASSSSVATTTTSSGGNNNNNNASSPKKKKRWANTAGVLHGKVAQSLGGVSRGGEVTHFVEAHYLWTPDQQQRQLEQQQKQQQLLLQEQKQKIVTRQQKRQNRRDDECHESDSSSCDKQQQQQQKQQDHSDASEKAAAEATTDTRSSVAAHSMRNYLMGISRESGPGQHPLVPDVPSEWLEFLEIVSK